jgi:hypothetical protein
MVPVFNFLFNRIASLETHGSSSLPTSRNDCSIVPTFVGKKTSKYCQPGTILLIGEPGTILLIGEPRFESPFWLTSQVVRTHCRVVVTQTTKTSDQGRFPFLTKTRQVIARVPARRGRNSDALALFPGFGSGCADVKENQYGRKDPD